MMQLPRRHRSREYATLVILLAGLLSLLPRGCSGDRGVTSMAQRGGPRELAFSLIDGGTWRLSEARGQVTAVNLWATWCGPCRAETPMLVRVRNDLGPRGFQVLGVSLDAAQGREGQVRSFRATYHVTYALAFPSPLSQIEAGLDGVPTTLLFDRHGRAAKVYVGEIAERTLRADVTELLREP